MKPTRALALSLLTALSATTLPLLTASPAAAAPSAPTVRAGVVHASAVKAFVEYDARDGIDRIRWTMTSPGLETVEVESRERKTLYANNLITGRTYTFAVRTVDVGGVESEPTIFNAVPTALPPLTVNGNPTLIENVVRADVQIAAPQNAPTTRYLLAYNELKPEGGYANYELWAQDVTATSLTFGDPAPAQPGVEATGIKQGYTYVFHSAATDVYGNRVVGRASSPRFAAPIDSERGALAGNAFTATRDGSYGGTSAMLAGRGASISLTMRGEVVTVIGERCPACGVVEVLVNGRVVATVDTAAPARSTQQTLFTKAFPTQRTVDVTVRSTGVGGRPTAVIDAFTTPDWVGPESRGGVQTGAYIRENRKELTSQPVSRTSTTARMQRDGNFVVRDSAGKPVWHTRTFGNPGAYLRVQGDGNMVIYSRENKPLWQSRTRTAVGAYLMMGRDANLVLYRATDGRALWSSKTGKL